MTDTGQDTQRLSELADYLDARANARLARVTTALTTLTRHERRILREAAVMGYVLGYRTGNLDGRTGHGGPFDRAARDRMPPDADIVADVIQHCDTTADLYPYIAATCNGRRRRITRTRLWPGEDTA